MKYDYLSNWRPVFRKKDGGTLNVLRTIRHLTDFIYLDDSAEFDEEDFYLQGDLWQKEGIKHDVTVGRISKMVKISGQEKIDVLMDMMPGMAMIDDIYIVTTDHGRRFALFASSASTEALEILSECYHLENHFEDTALPN
jgi:hypothetical protein